MKSAFACLSLLAAAPLAAQTFSAERVKADVTFLADDLLEGRGTGTRGYDLAARFVAARFAALGLQPAGTNGGWTQDVPFVGTQTDPSAPSAVTIAGRRFSNGGAAMLVPTTAEARIDGSAPAVFVGYGLEEKKFGLDDYRGLDVRGKIAVMLQGTPSGLPGEIAAMLNNRKLELAAAKGAVGVLTIATPTWLKSSSWATRVAGNTTPRVNWRHPDGRIEDSLATLRLSATLDRAAADTLLAGTPLSNGKLWTVLADRRARPKGFPLSVPVRVERNSRIAPMTSANVLGLLPGSDPALAREMVMLTGHLDHLGILPSKDGDTIANGAMDNAAGIATMLEAARAFVDSGVRPKRSILFVALTGEEKGLQGSSYLARYPLPAAHRTVANVNLDMPILTYDFADVIAFGAEHSTMGPTVARALAQDGLTLSPDPTPDEGLFTRSDHYSFVKEGIPAVFLKTGFGGSGKTASEKFRTAHYHQVSDQVDGSFDWKAGARFARVNYLIARELADAPQAPKWYQGSYFGDLFAPKQPKAPRP